MKLTRTFGVAVLVLNVSGCMSLGRSPEQLILGSWQSAIGGFPVIVEYTVETVQVKGHDAIPYQILDGVLSLAQEGSNTRAVSFPSRNEMVQVDSITGTEHAYTRLN
ncbi:MAG: hypothetical protein VB957_17480 [Pseudomonadales bacterium]